ncbi:MAG TPA: radical SAM protein, partial [bacterium]
MKKPLKHLTNLLRFNRGADIPTMGPLKAEWQVINQCNAKCLTCQDWQGRIDPTLLNTAEGKRLIRELADSGVLHLCFSGGEPLLRRDLIDLINYAKKQGLTTSLMTNGLILTERRARELANAKLDTVFISLDAADPKLNDEIRGLRGYFNLAMSAIDNVKAMRSGGKPGIIIKATVSSKNVRHLAALAELADRRGIEGFRFQLAQVVKNANFVFDRSLLLTDKERAILVQQLDRLIQRFAYLLSGSLEYYQGLRDFLERPESVRKFRSISGFSFVVIDPWGRLFTSPAKVQEIGNIRRDSFQ